MDAEIEATGPQQVVYLPSQWRNTRYIFPLVTTIFAGIVLWATLSGSPPPDALTIGVAVVGALIFVAIGVAVYFGISQVRLVLTPAGISYHNLGYRVVAPWANVTGTGIITSGGSSYDGLFLRDPRVELDPWLGAGIKAGPLFALLGAFTGRFVSRSGSVAALGQGIPVGLFDPAWQDSALGATIRRYAPHAFVLADSPSPPPT
jgi:hypothetical protein